MMASNYSSLYDLTCYYKMYVLKQGRQHLLTLHMQCSSIFCIPNCIEQILSCVGISGYFDVFPYLMHCCLQIDLDTSIDLSPMEYPLVYSIESIDIELFMYSISNITSKTVVLFQSGK